MLNNLPKIKPLAKLSVDLRQWDLSLIQVHLIQTLVICLCSSTWPELCAFRGGAAIAICHYCRAGRRHSWFLFHKHSSCSSRRAPKAKGLGPEPTAESQCGL